jgi:PilX N-terminal
MLRPRRPRARGPRLSFLRARRGVALVFVLIFVTAMAALAMSSIFMASTSNLLAKSYDREHDLKYAAEAALEMGKSRVNYDPLFLTFGPGTLYKKIPGLDSVQVDGANGQKLPGIFVRVYAGQTGISTGEYGRFSSIVAEARDQRNNGFIRRLELTQESFAKFAYWSDNESNGSGPIFFNNGDELWGPVWSNDTIRVGTGGAKFHDEVGTAQFVSGASYGVFIKGKKEYQKQIDLPTNAMLTRLQSYAALGNMAFTITSGASISQNESQLRDRIEFLAIDLGGATADSTDPNEGFMRRYTAKAGNDALLRGEWPAGSPPSVSQVQLCGDWHYMVGRNAQDTAPKFYPANVHATTWFRAQMESLYTQQPTKKVVMGYTSGTTASNAAKADSSESLSAIMTGAGARCYLPGDPHLVAVDRPSSYAVRDRRRGGDDTTFTANGVFGDWKAFPGTEPAVLAGRYDNGYLFPLDRFYNSNIKGVIYEPANVGVSGVVNGHITLYAKGSIVLLDDLRYANDPSKNLPCMQHDILGLLSDKDIVIANNAFNTPVYLTSSGVKYRNVDDTKDFYIHGVLMAMGTSFRAEDYNSGPDDINDCDVVDNGRGCIYLSGGIIQQARGPVGLSSGEGFSKRYSYDRCVIANPPPYFPTTGRFQDNRYVELDPAGFNPLQYFQSITQ